MPGDSDGDAGGGPGMGVPVNEPPQWRYAGAFDDLIRVLSTRTSALSIDLDSYLFDPEGGALRYAATGLPAGLTLNGSTGQIRGSITQASTSLSITATDSLGASMSASSTSGGFPPGGPDTGDLVIEIPGSWTAETWRDTVHIWNGSGNVFLGHADGTARLLRVTGANILVTDGKAHFSHAVVYAANGPTTQPLFTGNFVIDLATLRSSQFSESLGNYPANADFDLANRIDLKFGSLEIDPNKVTFGVDAIWDQFNVGTSGFPFGLRVNQSGAYLQGGQFGTGQWDFNIDLKGKGWDLKLEDVGATWDSLRDAVYLTGRGTVNGAIFGSKTKYEMVIDAAGRTEPETGIFAPGDKFLRYSADDGFDMVGSLTVTAKKGGQGLDKIKYLGLKELKLEVDTVEDAYSGSGKVALPFLKGMEFGAGLHFAAGFNLDGFGVSFNNSEAGINQIKSIPLFGLFLTGGSFDLTGLARKGEDDPTVNADMSFDFTLGPPAKSAVKGEMGADFTLNFRDAPLWIDGVKFHWEFDSKLRYLFNKSEIKDIENGKIKDFPMLKAMTKWFGVAKDALLDFEFMAGRGTWKLDGVKGTGDVSVDMDFFGGALGGRVNFTLNQSGDMSFLTKVAGRLPADLPVIGGKELGAVNLYANHSADGDFTNDHLTVWANINAFGAQAAVGFRVGFDGAFDWVGTEDVPVLSNAAARGGRWVLDEGMSWVMLTASWDKADRDARLVLVTPDGQRLTEAQISRRDDMRIVTELTGPYSRSVLIATPDDGSWDLRVRSARDLGDVQYRAGEGAARADIRLAGVTLDPATRKMQITVDAGSAPRGTEVQFFADSDRKGANGVALSDTTFTLTGGEQTFTLNMRDAPAGRAFVYAVATAPDAAPDFAYAATATSLNEISGTRRADVLTGTKWAEHITGLAGKDKIAPGLGQDTVDGGRGADTVSFADLNRKLVVDLELGTAKGAGVNTRLTRIEHVEGSTRADRLVGDLKDNRLAGMGGNDTLIGGDGKDTLAGGAGNDRISGGSGGDRIDGGGGRDRLSGEAGRDVFVFDALTDMGKNARADRIVDFVHGEDRIDLSEVMPDGRFIAGRAFHERAGEVRYLRDSGRLMGDVDGNGVADWHIVIVNEARLTGSDFIF